VTQTRARSLATQPPISADGGKRWGLLPKGGYGHLFEILLGIRNRTGLFTNLAQISRPTIPATRFKNLFLARGPMHGNPIRENAAIRVGGTFRYTHRRKSLTEMPHDRVPD
jgi:hypothetical protein